MHPDIHSGKYVSVVRLFFVAIDGNKLDILSIIQKPEEMLRDFVRTFYTLRNGMKGEGS